MSIESLLARYLAECGRLGIHGEIRAVEQQRAEIVARNGTVESEGLTSESLISLTVSDGSGWAVLAGGTDVDPATMVAEGCALLRSTSGQADGRAPATAAASGTGTIRVVVWPSTRTGTGSAPPPCCLRHANAS